MTNTTIVIDLTTPGTDPRIDTWTTEYLDTGAYWLEWLECAEYGALSRADELERLYNTIRQETTT